MTNREKRMMGASFNLTMIAMGDYPWMTEDEANGMMTQAGYPRFSYGRGDVDGWHAIAYGAAKSGTDIDVRALVRWMSSREGRNHQVT